MASVQIIVVQWADDAQGMALAAKRGWKNGDSLYDFIEESEIEETKSGFSSITKAKQWAARNKLRDIFQQPSIAVYEWPNERRFSWERETVRRLRYIGYGHGWEELDLWD